MAANTILPHVRPRLQRPTRGGSQLPALIVQPPARPVAVPTAEQARARRQLIRIYSLVGLFLFAGWLAKPAPRAEAETAPETVTVGKHVFVEATATPAPAGTTRMAKLSHYTPWTGGVNCAVFRNGQCVSNMASGLPWEAWVGRAAACPAELPFWTAIILPGGEIFTCLDRGGKIVTEADGTMWIDLLVASPPVPFGSVLPVTVVLP
jgi:hypothetical protein